MEITSKVLGGAELIDAEGVLKKSGLEANMKVGDFGCGGRAYFALQAAKLVGKDGLVYAIDILKAHLKSVDDLARFYNFKNIKTVWADLEIPGSTKIESGSLDFVIITNLFFQTKKHQEIWQEVARVLKTGGKVFVADWGRAASPIGPPIEMRTDVGKIKNMAQNYQFSLIDEFPAGPYHFGLVFVKE